VCFVKYIAWAVRLQLGFFLNLFNQLFKVIILYHLYTSLNSLHTLFYHLAKNSPVPVWMMPSIKKTTKEPFINGSLSVAKILELSSENSFKKETLNNKMMPKCKSEQHKMLNQPALSQFDPGDASHSHYCTRAGRMLYFHLWASSLYKGRVCGLQGDPLKLK
jgi:hypothetical protein